MTLYLAALPTPEQINDLRTAASKLTQGNRRKFAAKMALKYCDGSTRKTEELFGWGRDMVKTGLGEIRTGIHCMGAQSNFSGNARWEALHPNAAKVLCEIAESHAQQDSSFTTEIAFTRLTAEEALNQLRKRGFSNEELPASGTMAKILNRLGYRLRPVVKSKPQKKFQKQMPSLSISRKKTQKIKGMARNV